MKCANCSKNAFYIYQITESKQIFYCNTDLPKFLEQAKNAGLLKTTESFKSAIEEGFKKVLNTSEEPIIEVETTSTTTPSKKPIKKAATKNDTDS